MEQREKTPETTEGPYYKRGSPERFEIRHEGVRGDILSLSGTVFDRNGNAVAGAWLDFWQADGEGRYDNEGYTLRGHQFSSESGRYSLETVVPGSYPGRTPHIHVKVSPADRASELTTQLFFPGLPSNQSDPIFRSVLLIDISTTPSGKSGTFDFVVDTE